MNLNEILGILRSYPAFDIEKPDGIILRKQLKPGQDAEEILRSYAAMHGRLRIIPKRKQGNAFIRDTSSIMELGAVSDPLSYSLAGISPGQPSVADNSGEIYRIMWEAEKQNAREYRDKYEKTLEELRKLEVEHAASKNNVLGDIVGGLAGVLPSVIGGQVPALGSAQPAPNNNLQPVTDKRLVGIISYYNKLDEQGKAKIYSLLAKVFQNMQKIDDVISLMD